MAESRQSKIRRALRQQAENETLVSRGVRDAQRVWKPHERKIISAATQGRATRALLNKAFRDLEPLMIDAMQFFYLRGFKRSRDAARAHAGDFIKLSYETETANLIDELPLTAAQVSALSTTMTSEIRRVLLLTKTQLEKRINTVLRNVRQSGVNKREAVKQIRSTIVNANVSTHQIETLYRTTTNMAYNAARWEANQDSVIQQMLWGYEYVTVGDNRVRDEHAVLDRVRYAKDNPIWNTIWPPSGWSCRCSTIEIYDDENLATTRRVEQNADANTQIDAGQLRMREKKNGQWGKWRPIASKGFDVNFGKLLS